MADAQKTVEELKEKILNFADERGWYPGLKNLAISLVIEAAEVLEHFQWADPEQSEKAVVDKKRRQKIGRELVDVLFYLVKMYDQLGLDMTDSLDEKLDRLAKKYPKELVKDKLASEDYYRLKKEWRRKGFDD